MKIFIKKLSNFATIPSKASEFAAGYDLYAAEDAFITGLQRKLIKTDISIQIPNGYYGRIAPRSGLAYKNGIDVLAGVIDSDYRGNIGVIIFNTDSNNAFSIRRGDRIAQIIIETCASPTWEEVDSLENTNRENGGFGSTGIK
jgi:dUTP pyrophosphatase